jgi:hypothetical protein
VLPAARSRAPSSAPPTPDASFASWPSARTFDAGTNADVTGVIEDGPVDFRWAVATLSSDGLLVQLRTEPGPPCKPSSPLDPAGFTAEIVLPPGPGGTFFVGHDVGVPIELVGPVHVRGTAWGRRGVLPDSVTVDVEPFERRDGARIRGRVSMAERAMTAADSVTSTHLAGSFDATLCLPSIPSIDPLPAAAPPGLVAGTIGGKAFKTLSAVALVDRGTVDNAASIDKILFFPHATGTCAQPWDTEFAFAPFSLYVGHIGGAVYALGDEEPSTAKGSFGGTFDALVCLNE